MLSAEFRVAQHAYDAPSIHDKSNEIAGFDIPWKFANFSSWILQEFPIAGTVEMLSLLEIWNSCLSSEFSESFSFSNGFHKYILVSPFFGQRSRTKLWIFLNTDSCYIRRISHLIVTIHSSLKFCIQMIPHRWKVF